MILDGEQVLEGVSKTFVKYPGEEHSAWLQRLTHLHCQNQGITKIADLTSCSNLTVLYLYNNKIKSIEALDSAPHIQLLYLQNNKISRMSGLEKLKKLKKLYLTKNRIQVLEGLLENRALEELHIDRQMLRPGEHFVMDPRNCLVLAKCLHLLNISGSNVHDLAGVELISGVRSLMASDNHLQSMDSVLDIISKLGMLQQLDLRNNPQLNKSPMYRTKLIAHGRGLQILDGREIDPNNRILAQQISSKKTQARSSSLRRKSQEQSGDYCQESLDSHGSSPTQ